MKKRLFDLKSLDEMCVFICRQLSPSGSYEKDKETLYYAVCWQLCQIYDRQINFAESLSRLDNYRQLIVSLLNQHFDEGFSAFSIVENDIEEYLALHYPDNENFRQQLNAA